MKPLAVSIIVVVVVLVMSTSCDPHEVDNYSPRTAVEQNRSLKRGVSFGFQYIDDVNTLSPGISWYYNWGSAHSSAYDEVLSTEQIDYCPMAWNGINESMIRAYVSSHPDCQYLLAYNEPNLTDQANMTPTEAAQKWGEIKSIADDLGLKLISPAMNYGTLQGYSDPIVWLDEFFSLVPISDIEGIAVHCYMPNANSVKSYIERFKKYNKPVWLTEFCAWDGLNEDIYKVENQQEYMSDIINYLESDSMIFRYAWFIPRGNGSEDNFPYMFLLKNSPIVELTELGNIFIQMSSQDKSIHYVEQQLIEAEHYSSISIAESTVDKWMSGPRVRITTDAPNESLELYNFLSDQWVEYQIEADRSKEFDLQLRYACFVDSELSIEIDGQETSSLLLNNTLKEYIWNTASVKLPLEKGKHTLRITLTKGKICMNWLKFI